MSLNAAANAALARRPDYSPEDQTPSNLPDVAKAAATNPPGIQTTATTLQTITLSIPTEVITLNVALVAALGPIAAKNPEGVGGRWLAFGVFVLFTPIAQWMTFASKLKGDNKPLPKSVNSWPKWEMLASTLAFLAWAVALPNSPFSVLGWYSPAVAGVFVLAGSTILGMMAPLFQQRLAID
ncbi:MAG TPA: hypothetical protein VFN11_14030 [Ktedonobacterales bacterium]|nr:hypothetical protein [Ktedonobacterales bacterium]